MNASVSSQRRLSLGLILGLIILALITLNSSEASARCQTNTNDQWICAGDQAWFNGYLLSKTQMDELLTIMRRQADAIEGAKELLKDREVQVQEALEWGDRLTALNRQVNAELELESQRKKRWRTAFVVSASVNVVVVAVGVVLFQAVHTGGGHGQH